LYHSPQIKSCICGIFCLRG